MIDTVVIALGIVLMVMLSRLSVDRALLLADHIRVSGTLVGLTVLSIGTSLPEISVHVAGSIRILREPDKLDRISGLVVGGNIGSDIFQQDFALPLVALVGAVLVARHDAFAEIGGLIAAAIVVLMVGLGGVISRFEGIGLVALYLLYMWQLYARGIGGDANESERLPPRSARGIALSLGTALVLLAVVATVVLSRAERVVDRTGLSASFVGVVTLGVAAALPELTTALAAVRRGESGAAAGILIGSNVTNPLLALGVGATISTYTVPTVIVAYDLPFKIATAILIAVFFRHTALGRGQAVSLMVLYSLYLGARLVLFPADVV